MTSVNLQSSILVADKDAAIRDVVSRYLARQGYDMLTASTGEQVLESVALKQAHCMLLDARFVGEHAADLIFRVHHLDPDIAVIMMSGSGDAAANAECQRAGATDVVTKPFDLAGLAGAIAQALCERQDAVERREVKRWLSDDEARRRDQFQQDQVTSERHSAASLDALVLALENKDPFMAGHSMRVAQLAASIASELGRTDEEVGVMRLAGRVHDIGVVGIGDGILSKRGSLTASEFDEVKRHVTIGAQILEPYPHLGAVAAFVRGHHERWDGTGYPEGLSGTSIPWGARVLAASEIYDAITSARPHRARIPAEAAIQQMAAMSESTLEPAVFKALASVVARGQALDFLQEIHGGEDESQMTHAVAMA